MRLFRGLSSRIAAQALFAALIAGAALVLQPHLARHGGVELQYAWAGAVAVVLFILILATSRAIASRAAAPIETLYALSDDLLEGRELLVTENAPEQVSAAARNLARVADRYERLESARRTWLIATADELRSPVTTIGKQLTELLQRHPAIDLNLFDRLGEEQQRMARMTDDLQMVALADLGRLPVQFAPVDPQPLIEQAIWAATDRAKRAGVRLSAAQLPAAPLTVHWDAARIEQLLDALIENALRYTPFAGAVTLALESHREAWHLTVEDSAPGVDISLAQQLFDPFYRSIEAGNASSIASGLELATARAIVDAHYGRIEAARSSLGGLRVTVVLPANPPIA